ncbi:MAG: protein kinase [Planctomycetes bacterium]|nr:protein kinase [Planctomycetota bacterium]
MDPSTRAEDVEFGKRLIRLGLATPEQVKECLGQERQSQEGEIRLGDLLIRKGYVTFESLQKAIRARGEEEGSAARTRVLPGHDSPGPTGAGLADLEGAPPDVCQAARDAKRRFGKYVLVRELGRGGMGAVHLAWDTVLCRWVALKFLTPAGDEHEVERFFREARTVAGLSHPHIAQVFEVGERDGKHFLAMQYVDGPNLGDRKLAPRRAIEVVRDAALAVEFAHAKGIVHRDLKPDNLLADQEGTLFVTDFGLARSFATGSRITVTGSIVGTPAYMSPEQARGDTKRIGPLSDVYSLGATLYDLLTGRPPFAGENALETVALVLEKPPVRPSVRSRDVPAAAEAICLQAMQKDPSRRYPSARAMAEDCDRFLRGEKVAASPTAQGRRRRARSSSRSAPWAIAVGVCVGIPVLATAVILAGGRSSGPPAEEPPPDAGGPAKTPDSGVPAADDQALQKRRTAESLAEKGVARIEEATRTGYRPDARPSDEQPLLSGAVEILALAIDADPTWALPWRERGRARRLQGDLEGAVSDLSKSLEIDPGDAVARLQRGKALFRLHWQDLDRLGARWVAPELWLSRERLDRSAGDFEAVVAAGGAKMDLARAYVAFARLDPERCVRILDGEPPDGVAPDEWPCLRAEARHWRASVVLPETDTEGRRREWMTALKDYQRAVLVRPTNIVAWLLYADCTKQTGDREGARSMFQVALGYFPESPLVLCGLAELYFHDARLQKGAGQSSAANELYATALELYVQAIRADPDYVPARYGRGAVYAELDRWGDAAEDLERTVALNPKHAYGLYTLSLARMKQGRNEEALRLLDRAIESRSDVASFFYFRGLLHELFGHRPEAISDLERATELDTMGLFRAAIQAALQRLRDR